MGIAKIYESNGLPTIGLGCGFYMPPEFYAHNYSLKLDVYTFGLTLNELFNGKHAIHCGKIEIVKKCELIWEMFVYKMIDNDPNHRPTSKVLDEKLEFIDRFIKEKYKNSSNISDSIFESSYLSALQSYKDEKLKEEKEIIREKNEKRRLFCEKYLKLYEETKLERFEIIYCTKMMCELYFNEKNKEKYFYYCEELMKQTKRLFKNDNLRISHVFHYFGYYYLTIEKDFNKALNYYQEALNMRLEVCEENNSYVSFSYKRVGDCYFEMNQFKDALSNYMKSLEIRRIIYDSKHECIDECLDCIKDCYLKLDDIDNYLNYRNQSLKIKRDLFKKKNPNKDYFDVFPVRGKDEGKPAWHYVILKNEEKYQELKRLKAGTNIDVTDFGEIIESGWGEDPPFYIDDYINDLYYFEYPSKFNETKLEGKPLSSFLDKDADRADPILEIMFANLKYCLDYEKDDIIIVERLLFTANYYLDKLEDSTNCMLLCKKALEICDCLFENQNNEYVAIAYSYMAGCYLHYLDNPKEAIELYKKAIKIRKTIFKDPYSPLSTNLYDVGVCFFKLNNIEEALRYLKECLNLRIQIFDRLNKYVLDPLLKIEEFYESSNDTENYLKYRNQSLEIKRHLFKKKNPKKEYFDVILVKRKDTEKPVWHYILIQNEEKYQELKRQKAGTVIDVSEYGEIIISGFGQKPSKIIKKEIESKYGCYFK
jgi:tetratricopeptide (TPR) repeat protein